MVAAFYTPRTYAYPPVPNVRPGRCALDGLKLGPGMGVIVVGRDQGGKVAITLHGNCLGKIEARIKEDA